MHKLHCRHQSQAPLQPMAETLKSEEAMMKEQPTEVLSMLAR